MKKRKTRIRWGRVCVAGIILMLVLKLLASFVMTAFEKDMKNWDLEKVQKKPVHLLQSRKNCPKTK